MLFLEEENAEVIMRGRKIAIDSDGVLISVDCFVRLPAGVIGQTKVIPDLGMFGHQFRRAEEIFQSFFVVALLQILLAQQE